MLLHSASAAADAVVLLVTRARVVANIGCVLRARLDHHRVPVPSHDRVLPGVPLVARRDDDFLLLVCVENDVVSVQVTRLLLVLPTQAGRARYLISRQRRAQERPRGLHNLFRLVPHQLLAANCLAVRC